MTAILVSEVETNWILMPFFPGIRTFAQLLPERDRIPRCSYLSQSGVDTGGEAERPVNTAIKSKA